MHSWQKVTSFDAPYCFLLPPRYDGALTQACTNDAPPWWGARASSRMARCEQTLPTGRLRLTARAAPSTRGPFESDQ